jgi:hypothetical protein
MEVSALGLHRAAFSASDTFFPALIMLQAEGTVNVRTRDNVVHGMRPIDEVKQLLAQERNSRSLGSAFGSKHEDGEQQQEAAPAADS